MAKLRQYSEQTDKEIRSLLEQQRQALTFGGGLLPPNTFDNSGRESRWFRTDENAITTDYPEFEDEIGHQLPCKLLQVVYVEGDPDPVTVDTIDDNKSWYIYSPYGWIPQFIDIHATLNFGLWVPTYIPELEVEITESGGIAAESSGEVTIVKHGSANGQTLTAWFDHMASGVADEDAEARIALMPGEKKWRIVNLGCSS